MDLPRLQISNIKVLDKIIVDEKKEKKRRHSSSYDYVKPRVSAEAKQVSPSHNDGFRDFKSNLKMTQKAHSKFKDCFNKPETSTRQLSRREEIEKEKEEFRSKFTTERKKTAVKK